MSTAQKQVEKCPRKPEKGFKKRRKIMKMKK